MKWKNDKLILERGETIRIFGRDKAKKGDLEATERIALPDTAFKEGDLSLEGGENIK